MHSGVLQMRIEPFPNNPEWGSITVSFEGEEHAFTYHVPSGEVFNDDSAFLIRKKCFGLILGTPLFSLARSIAWFAHGCFMLLSEAFYILDGQPISDEMKAERINKFEDIGRALKYGYWLTGYACAGIVYPYWARQQYGHLERELNRHPDGPHRSKHYLAFCFQRIFMMPQDPTQQAAVEGRLTNYLALVRAFHDAGDSFSLSQINIAANNLQQGV